MLMEGGLVTDGADGWTIDAADGLDLPDTVHGIIGARLDRLGPNERSLIGDAAVLAVAIGTDGLSHMSRDTARGGRRAAGHVRASGPAATGSRPGRRTRDAPGVHARPDPRLCL